LDTSIVPWDVNELLGAEMNYAHALLIAAIVTVIVLSRVIRAKWIAVVAGAAFALVQCLELGLGLDAEARRVLVSELQAGRGVQHVSQINAAIKHAQIPVRMTVLLAGIGLFVTICCWVSPVGAKSPRVGKDE
jgi:hypothetical protein